MMVSSIECFTDTSGSPDAITVVFFRKRILLGGGGGTGVSGILRVIRLRVGGGGGGGAGVSPRTLPLDCDVSL